MYFTDLIINNTELPIDLCNLITKMSYKNDHSYFSDIRITPRTGYIWFKIKSRLNFLDPEGLLHVCGPNEYRPEIYDLTWSIKTGIVPLNEVSSYVFNYWYFGEAATEEIQEFINTKFG